MPIKLRILLAATALWICTGGIIRGSETANIDSAKTECGTGDPEACFLYGYMASTIGNNLEACVAYEKACAQGHGKACYNLGTLYENSSELQEASMFYKKACDANPSAGCAPYGRLAYRQGDKATGLRYSKMACDAKEAVGCYNNACYLSLQNKAAESAASLEKAIQLGWSDLEVIREDKDFDNVKDSKPFKTVLAKYDISVKLFSTPLGNLDQVMVHECAVWNRSACNATHLAADLVLLESIKKDKSYPYEMHVNKGYQEGLEALWSGDTPKTLRRMNQVLLLNPDHADAMFVAASIFVRMKRSETSEFANFLISRLQSVEPDSPRIKFLKSKI